MASPPSSSSDDRGCRGAEDASRALRLEGWLTSSQYDGIQLSVHRDGQRVVDLCCGSGAGDPLAVDDALPFFSASKPLVAVAVACAVDDGLLDFDDAVAVHLPEFGASGKSSIAIRQLLTHSVGQSAETTEKVDNTGLWAESAAELRAACEAEILVPSRDASGQVFHDYSGRWWHRVLAEVVARATATEFHAFVRQRVLEPLGIPGLSYGPSGPRARAILRAYLDPRVADDFADSPSPGVSYWGAARDLGTLFQAVEDARRGIESPLFSAEIGRRLTEYCFTSTDRVRVDQRRARNLCLLGVLEGREGAATRLRYSSFASRATYGFHGGESCMIFTDPSVRLTFSGLAVGQINTTLHGLAWQRLTRRVYTHLLDASELPG